MGVAFRGAAIPLDMADIGRAAAALGCDTAAVRAVIAVESGGGFLPDGRPRILFERHWFSRLTGGRHDRAIPDESNGRRGGYAGGAAEYVRLARASARDRDAALRSTSWGMFQIMGDNHRAAGHATVEGFVAAMMAGEGAQLAAFVAFVTVEGLADELRAHDWAGFARGYNGPGYRANRYDERLAAAHARAEAMLGEGDRGPAVARVQHALDVPADGVFGARTAAAVAAFQRRRGLAVDGMAGPATQRALGL